MDPLGPAIAIAEVALKSTGEDEMPGEMVIDANNIDGANSFGHGWGIPLRYDGQSGRWLGSFGGYEVAFTGTINVITGTNGQPVSFTTVLDGSFTLSTLTPSGGRLTVGTGTMPVFSYTSSFADGDFAQNRGNGIWDLYIHGSPNAPYPPLGPFGQFISDLDQIVFNGSDAKNVFEATYLETNTLMHGGAGDDFLIGAFRHSNQIFGEDGNDNLRGQGDNDYLDGGTGNDTVYDSDNAGDGTVQVGSQAHYNHDTLLGGDGNDQIMSSGGGDLLDGGAGDDFLQADGVYDDTLIGGAGNDTIWGGLGTDTAVFSGTRAQYTITEINDGTHSAFTVSGVDGVDQIHQVELLRFDDGTLSVANMNMLPTITSNGGGDTAAITVAENSTAVTTVTASDLDAGQTLTYAISGGADAARFTIDATTGALAFVTAPNFEAPTDAGGNNVYDVTVQISDGNGGIDTQAIAVTVTDVMENGAPVITSNGGGATASASVSENSRAVVTVTASDPDVGQVLTYSIVSAQNGGGADAAKFQIDPVTGALSFVAAPDFEKPSDAGFDNVYNVTVQVSDGNGSSDTQAIAVTVTNFAGITQTSNAAVITGTNEEDVLTGGAGANRFVGYAGHDVMDGGSGRDTVDYGAEGGPSAVYVNLLGRDQYPDPLIGPDGLVMGQDTAFDTFGDKDDIPNISDVIGTAFADHIYGGNHDNNLQGGEGDDILLGGGRDDTLDGGGGTDTAIYRGSRSDYTVVANADGSVTITDLRPDPVDPVKNVRNDGTDIVRGVELFQFTDGTLSLAALLTPPVPLNQPPVITSNGGGANASLSLAENTSSVTTVVATDPDAGQTVTYSIAGGADAGRFVINSSTGALAFVAAPNFEAPTDAGADNVYDVTVQAADGNGGVDTQMLAITVTDADEAAPELVSLVRVDPVLTNAASVHYTVTFSEPVTALDPALFTLATSGVSGASIASVTPVAGTNGAEYTVTINTGSGDGSLALHFNGNAVTDTAGNGLVGNPDSVLLPSSEIAVAGSHAGITSADIDNDGDQDVIVVTSDSSTAVLLGNGDGTFAAPVYYNSGINSADVAAGDLDGDQILDLVVTNYGFGVDTISVLHGNGDGTFLSPVTYNAGTTPWNIRLVDVDGDHKLDALVSNNSFSNGFSVLKGNGDGSFQPPVNYPGAGDPTGLAVADFNGDTIPDIAVVASLDGNLRIYLGSGDGTFTPSATLPTSASPFMVEAADFNGDGRQDVAWITYYGSISVSFGNGDGTFQAASPYSAALTGSDLAAADMNGDGHTDLVSSNGDVFSGSSKSISVLLNNGDGTFAAPSTYQTGSGTNFITSADLNGDGRPDIVSGNTSGTISVLLNSGANFAGQAYAIDKTADVGGDLAVSLSDLLIDETEKANVAFSVTGLDADASAIVTFASSGGSGSVTRSIAGSGTYAVDLTGLADGIVTIAITATDALGNTTSGTGGSLTLDTNASPAINSNGGGDTAAVSVAENTTSVTTVTASDPDPGDTLTYSISGGFDGNLFSIDGQTGALAFLQAPDFENPNLNGGVPDQFYDVRVRVTDTSGAFDEQLVTVTVTNVAGATQTSNAAVLTGTSEEDVLTGLGGANTLLGLAGNDVLNGGGGNDTLDGGAGADTMAGGTSNDTYVVDNIGDTVIENAGAGTDTVRTALAAYSLAALANVENLTYTGTGAFNGTGNGLPNVITGSSGNDVLDGGAGNDRMVGGLGDDTYHVDSASDAVIEQADGGSDLVLATANLFTLDANVENLTFVGAGNFTGTGNASDNIITGGSGNDTLDGRGGDDVIVGGSGADNLFGGAGADRLDGDAGADLLDGGAGNDVLVGGADADILLGGGGDDLLDGGLGADRMSGGAGDDVYIVDDQLDLVIENSGAGTDEVRTSLQTYTLSSNVEILTFVGPGPFTGTGNERNNTLTGGGSNDALAGGDGNDLLLGLAGNDTLSGGAGADTLIGGAGNDVLTGGAGNDAFVFYLPTNGVDTITDFGTGRDDLEFSASGFGGGLVSGQSAALVTAASIGAATHAGSGGYFIFDNAGANAGMLYWDATGGDGADAIAVVNLVGVTTLRAADLHIL